MAKLKSGMYNCTTVNGEAKVYHSSTIDAVAGTKAELKVGKRLEKYIPKGAKGNEVSVEEK